MSTELVELLKYASKTENAFAVGVIAGIIVFILLRKFYDSNYLKGAEQRLKEQEFQYNTLKSNYELLHQENQELKTEVREIKQKLEDNEKEIESLKSSRNS